MKKQAVNLLALIILITSLVSCGKSTKDQHIEEVSIANTHINAKNYEKAIEVLESATEKYPNQEEIKVKLAHAYAGAGGFESIKFSEQLKKLENIKLKGDVTKQLKTIGDVLSKFPQASDKQKLRLDQAIQLYTDLGFDPYSISGEVNFKWGVLHTFRMMRTLSEVVVFIGEVLIDRSHYTEDEKQKFLIEKGDLLAQDFYKSYLLYKNSFEKLNDIANKIDNLLINTVKNRAFTLKIESKARNYKDFVKDIIKNNKEILTLAFVNINHEIDLLNIEETIKSISQIISNKGGIIASDSKSIIKNRADYVKHRTQEIESEKSIKIIVKGFHDNKKDVKERTLKLRILANLFLENVILKHPSENEAINNIFNEDLNAQFQEALAMSFAEKNFTPLKDFFANKDSNMKTITQAWGILSSQYEDSLIQNIAQPEIKSLFDYIDMQQAITLKENTTKALVDNVNATKSGLIEVTETTVNGLVQISDDSTEIINTKNEDARRAQKRIEDITKETSDKVMDNSEDDFEELNEIRRNDENELKSDIDPYLEDVREAFELDDEKMDEKAPGIIEDVKEFIEQE